MHEIISRAKAKKKIFLILVLLFWGSSTYAKANVVNLVCEPKNIESSNLINLKIDYENSILNFEQSIDLKFYYDEDFIQGTVDIKDTRVNFARFKLSRKSGQLTYEAYNLKEGELNQLLESASIKLVESAKDLPWDTKIENYHQKIIYDQLEDSVFYGKVIYDCKLAENKF